MSGTWYKYLSILDEVHGFITVEPQMRLLACPNDGEPYSQAPDGGLFCRYDGYRPDGSYVGDRQRSYVRARY